MIIGIQKEIKPGERRIVVTPEYVRRFVNSGHSVIIEQGDGVYAGFPDNEYLESEAERLMIAEELQ